MLRKNILITGGAGFIGSNFIKLILNKSEEYHIVNFDSLAYSSNINYLNDVNKHKNYSFIQGDITDYKLVLKTLEKYQINHIIHFAAESHVDNSISRPDIFIKTNVNGTFNLLHAAYNLWFKSPNKVKNEFLNSKFIHISTDEVYGALGNDGFFTENSNYSPNSPYSASKASSDLIARSYFQTYGLNVITTNCSNNYGQNQHDEKLIPTIIKSALTNKNIPIYGNGKNIRDWLFVDDHCNAILKVLQSGTAGEKYNIGGDSEISNIDLCKIICNKLDKLVPMNSGKYFELVSHVKDREGHDFRYAIDYSKIKSSLGWRPTTSLNDGLEKTIKWYIQKFKHLQ